MIFALRAVMVSLAFFALLYSLLSVLVLLTWQVLRLCHPDKHMDVRSLFLLRMSPFAISAGISLFPTLPSFLLLETHSLDEDLGTFLLALCAVLIVGAGIYRVWTIEGRTRRIVYTCLQGAVGLEPDTEAPALILPESITPLMLVGIRVPRILISASAWKILSEGELRAAIRHETSHFRSRDNLKKAILNSLPFPGMASLEAAWQEASELAPDHDAVSSRDEALELAAALIKLARNFPCQATPGFATGLVSGVGLVTSRVERLVAWRESPDTRPHAWHYAVAMAVIACLGFAVKVGSTMALVHSLTERLVP